jgi:hypothetical protein
MKKIIRGIAVMIARKISGYSVSISSRYMNGAIII